jgi:hypothetical protein
MGRVGQRSSKERKYRSNRIKNPHCLYPRHVVPKSKDGKATVMCTQKKNKSDDQRDQRKGTDESCVGFLGPTFCTRATPPTRHIWARACGLDKLWRELYHREFGWSLESGVCLRVLEGHTNGVLCLAGDSKTNTLVSGSIDKTVRVWDSMSGECLYTLRGHTGFVLSIALLSNKVIVSGGGRSEIKMWCGEEGKRHHFLIAISDSTRCRLRAGNDSNSVA